MSNNERGLLVKKSSRSTWKISVRVESQLEATMGALGGLLGLLWFATSQQRFALGANASDCCGLA